jgi:hypothetical protein
MVKLLGYGDLNKDADSVLKSNFIYDRLFAFTFRSAAKQGFSYHSKVCFKGDPKTPGSIKLDAETGTEYKGKGYAVSVNHDPSDPSMTVKGKYEVPSVDGLKASGEASFKPDSAGIEKKGKFTLDYAHDQALGKLTVTSDP